MKFSINAGRRSATAKVAVIGLLVLVLLLPIGMIRSLIYDRVEVESEAVSDIRHSWGGDQLIAGPILRVPFRIERSTVYGSPYPEDQHAFLVADSLLTNASSVVETRYRGIHEVPVYTTDVTMAANFNLALLTDLGVDPASVDWTQVEVLLGISDAAAMNSIPVLTSADSSSNFAATIWQVAGLPSQLSANVGSQITLRPDADVFSAQISLAVNGTGTLQFLPLAESAEVRAAANWPSPSFDGRRLPAVREVREDGFDATWRATSLGRKLPAGWIDDEVTPSPSDDGVFGVRFMQPISLYQLMFRALKYAVMFVGLTFVSYFLVETIGKLRLHPLQYLLIGFSNTVFYLLLLSLAEHIGFGLAYVVSACASSTLIVTYSATVLAGRRRAVVIGAVLAGLYSFLYLTLTAENYALLAGSVGLWCMLAVVMYLTRKVNWYSAEAADQKQAVVS